MQQRKGFYWIILLCFLGLIIGFSSLEGDADSYLNWARAFSQGSLASLESKTLSYQSRPVVQQAHGIGLLLSFLGPKIFTSELALRILACFLSLFILYCLYQMGLRHRELSCALLATPMLYYFFALQGELIWLALACSGLFFFNQGHRQSLLHIIAILSLAGLTIITRHQFLVFWPCLILAIRDRFEVRWSALILLNGAILAPSLYQIFELNWLMTGHPFRSPYAFELGPLKAFNWTQPEIWGLLFSPQNGLLVYHPIFLLGPYCLYRWLKDEKSVYTIKTKLSFCLSIFLYFYSFAAYFIYWSGMSSDFGQRGLVWLTPFFLYALKSYIRSKPLERFLVFSLVWSTLFLARALNELWSDAFNVTVRWVDLFQSLITGKHLLIFGLLWIMFALSDKLIPQVGDSLSRTSSTRSLNFLSGVLLFLFTAAQFRYQSMEKQAVSSEQFIWRDSIETQELEEGLKEYLIFPQNSSSIGVLNQALKRRLISTQL